jgi:hypothetical protein
MRPNPKVDALSSKNPDAHAIWRQHSRGCAAGLRVAPRTGRAVLFYSHRPGAGGAVGELDRYSFHAGCDVLAGEKWIANHWLEVGGSFRRSLVCELSTSDSPSVLHKVPRSNRPCQVPPPFCGPDGELGPCADADARAGEAGDGPPFDAGFDAGGIFVRARAAGSDGLSQQ